MIYSSRANQPIKWLAAVFVFVLVMGVTFSDVYGVDQSGSPNSGSGNPSDGRFDGSSDKSGTSNETPPPTAVPEPSTIILLAGGLGALYAARHLRKRK